MISRLRILLFCLAALATGMAQVFGVQAGYLCGCTGKQSVEAVCEGNACHPEQPVTDQAAPQMEGLKDTADRGCPPADHQHEHSEIREQLVVTGLAPLATLPPAVLYDLPWPFQSPDYGMLDLAPVRGEERPEPLDTGSPPMPLLVAETIVMLV